MRTTSFTQHVYQSLIFSLFVATSPVAMSADFAPSMLSAESQQWMCSYTVGQKGVWFMRCEDLTNMENDDPALNDDTSSHQTKFIPLWNAPYADSRAPELARALLCSSNSACSVDLASQ